MENQNEKGMNLWVAAGLGVLAGVAVGLLIAPAKGEETRENIGNWLNTQKQKFSHKTEQVNAAITAGKKAYSENLKNEKELVGSAR